MLFISVKFLDTKVSQAWVWSEQKDGWKKQISIGCCQQRIYISRGAITNGKKFYSFRGWCLEVRICMEIIIIHICIYLSREHLSASVFFMEVWSNFLIFIHFLKKKLYNGYAAVICIFLLFFFLFVKDLFKNPDAHFYTEEIYVQQDEVSIAPILNEVDEEFKVDVTLGSYPDFHNK